MERRMKTKEHMICLSGRNNESESELCRGVETGVKMKDLSLEECCLCPRCVLGVEVSQVMLLLLEEEDQVGGAFILTLNRDTSLAP